MKKVIFVLASIVAILLTSCNKNELSSEEFSLKKESVINVSNDGIEPDSVVFKFVEEHPKYYIFEDSHSDFWIDENNRSTSLLRSTTAQPSISVTGYDVKTQIGSGVTLFPSGLSCDSRVRSSVYYAYKKYQYKKVIMIPAGSDLVLPPQSVMSTLIPMGVKPGTSSGSGYSSSFVSTDGVIDTYYLITEGNEIVYNSSGQQVAPLNDPIYTPCKIRTPSQLLFKYQYTEVEW